MAAPVASQRVRAPFLARGNTVEALLQRPRQLALLLKGAHPWSSAVEAGLAHASPVRYALMRYTTQKTRIAGVDVPKGDPVIVGIAAAGRPSCPHARQADSTPPANTFDITGERPQHLGFGQFAHHCPGATLARAEAEIALSALFTR